MKRVAVTQRVSLVPERGERRDCLDQAWTRFLTACDLLPVLLPNVTKAALALCAPGDVSGVVLTGGNDLEALGGDVPERDAVERALLDLAEERSLPLLGVCRGMQAIQQRFAVPLLRVEGHVTPRHDIRVEGGLREVNSYHRFAAFETRSPLDVCAVANDGVIEAVRHSTLPVTGIMWHPERCSPFTPEDVLLFRDVFSAVTCCP